MFTSLHLSVKCLLYPLPFPSFSPSIYPSSSWLPQVLQQLSQHALLSPCGFDKAVLQRYWTHSWLWFAKCAPTFSVPPPPPSCSVRVTSCHSPPALFSEPVSSSLSAPSGPDVWGMEVTSDPRPRALSVLAVRPELDTLYRKMNEQNRGEGPGMVCATCEINL